MAYGHDHKHCMVVQTILDIDERRPPSTTSASTPPLAPSILSSGTTAPHVKTAVGCHLPSLLIVVNPRAYFLRNRGVAKLMLQRRYLGESVNVVELYRQLYTVKVHNINYTTLVQHFRLIWDSVFYLDSVASIFRRVFRLQVSMSKVAPCFS